MVCHWLCACCCVVQWSNLPLLCPAMSDEYAEASPEQKLNIATYFMQSSPVGEIDEVVTGQWTPRWALTPTHSHVEAAAAALVKGDTREHGIG